MTARIAFRCDAGPSVGVGHVMRCLALAEELHSRGATPVFFCDAASVPWLAGQLRVREFAVEPAPSSPEDHLRALGSGFDAVVFDSYVLTRDVYHLVRAAGPVTMAVVDGDLRAADADLFLDQNAGAELDDVRLPDGSRMLAGLTYALFRSDVLRHRPPEPPKSRPARSPETLVVFGGTDTYGAGPVAISALARTGLPFHATLVVPREDLRTDAERVPLSSGQRITLIDPTDHLPELVVASDLVVSAAGSSTWELLALGACAALVWVADNQRNGYRRMVDSGVATGLGDLAGLGSSSSDVSTSLNRLLTDATWRDRQAAAAWSTVDGHGRERVATALLDLIGERR